MGKNKRILAWVALALIAFTVLSFVSFYVETKDKEFRRIETMIDNSTKSDLISLESGLSSKVKALEDFAYTISESSSSNLSERLEWLNKRSQVHDFSSVALINAKGEMVTYPDIKEDVSKQDFFEKALQGESFVSDVFIAYADKKPSIRFTVPVMQQETTVALVSAVMRTEDLVTEFCGDTLFDNGKVYVVGSNLKSIIGAAIMSRIRSDIESRREGSIKYNQGGMRTYYYYSPIPSSDLYLLKTFPQDIYSKSLNHDFFISLKLLFEVLLVLAILMFWLVRKERRHTTKMKELFQNIDAIADNVPGGILTYSAENGEIRYISDGCLQMFNMREREFRLYSDDTFENIIFIKDRARAVQEMNEQAEKSDTIDVFYRVETSDKKMLWVRHIAKLLLRVDGSREYCVVLNDVTQQHDMEQELRIRDTRFNMVVENTNTTVFEWKVRDDILMFPCNYMAQLGIEDKYAHFLTKRTMASVIYPDDHTAFYEFFKSLKEGAESGNVEFRIEDGNTPVWFEISAKTLFSEDGAALSVVGSVINIDKGKKRMESLQEKSLRDTFSGLYNKVATRMMIDAALSEESEPGERHALVAIDLDNFKSVNDNIGHLTGDEVLKTTAKRLVKAFRSDDIIGRIGGDEFVVLMKSVPDDESVIKKMQQLVRALQEKLKDNDGSDHLVTASMGVAFYPQDGEDYETLFAKSDRALYDVKRSTKNGYKIYKNEE